MIRKRENPRAYVVFVLLACCFLLITVRLFHIQIINSGFFIRLAEQQHLRTVPLKGDRGRVFDRRGRLVAGNISSYSVYVDPKMIRDKKHAAGRLSDILGLDIQKVTEMINRDNRFVWIKRKIPYEEKTEVERLNDEGVGLRREDKRFYPHGRLMSHVLGGVNIDNRGIEGGELFYDNVLSGKDGKVTIFRDAAGRMLIGSSEVINPQDGCDITLTIDAQIQYWVEKYLKETIEEFHAKAGSAVVMDPSTGEILAMANYPDFDPNNIGAFTYDDLRNRAVTDVFEPGSVFKIVALTAAVDQELYSDDDIIFCEKGSFRIPGSVLRDFRPYGNLTFAEVFTKSSNIGTAKVAVSLGREVLYDYIEKFGFAGATGINLPGEVSGMLKRPSQWSKTSLYMIPMGQEIGVTAIQLASALSVIAGEGYLSKPYIVRKISCGYGQTEYMPVEKEKVFSDDVIKRVKNILLGGIEDGTGRAAKIKGIKAGGKTGTAQKYDPSIGRYSPNRYRASFIGFLPKDEAKLVIAVTIDEPRKVHYGGVVAAPFFRKVGSKAMEYIESNYD